MAGVLGLIGAAERSGVRFLLAHVPLLGRLAPAVLLIDGRIGELK